MDRLLESTGSKSDRMGANRKKLMKSSELNTIVKVSILFYEFRKIVKVSNDYM